MSKQKVSQQKKKAKCYKYIPFKQPIIRPSTAWGITPVQPAKHEKLQQ